MNEMITYSNPRIRAVIPNWPDGGKRVTATFEIETVEGKGQRAVRTTTGKPKKLTYARRMRIVDGDDGRTYIAREHGAAPAAATRSYSIMRGDMKYCEEGGADPGSPRHAELKALFQMEHAHD
jgi:hypothetical protein